MIKHYLITIAVGQNHLHAYVMTDDPSVINTVIDTMMNITEKAGPVLLPIMLQTTLDTGVDLVRGILCKYDEKLRESFDNSKRYHLTMFTMPSDHPDDKLLMELH
jgi:hypothetical protein